MTRPVARQGRSAAATRVGSTEAPMPESPCPDEQRLLRFAEGLLESAESGEVERHLDLCSSCVTVLAAFAHTSGAALAWDGVAAGAGETSGARAEADADTVPETSGAGAEVDAALVRAG